MAAPPGVAPAHSRALSQIGDGFRAGSAIEGMNRGSDLTR